MKRRDFLTGSLIAASASIPGFHSTRALARTGAIPDVPAVTGDNREIVLRGKDIAEFARQLHGNVLLSGEPGYDDARRIMNPSFDRKPALIAQVTDAADVQSAVNFAKSHSLLLAVKCGGHSSSGQSTCDRGMLIDLSKFRGVHVDANARLAKVAGGSLLGQVDHAALKHGLVTPLGTVSHTGVGGLTLGGGFGRIGRRFGMSIDNLDAVEIVTADGRLLNASAEENPDLFWGVRGGSGNFGVVTRFDFRLHPMQREVIAGDITFPIARARDVLSMIAEYGPAAPDELYIEPVMSIPPGGAPGIVLLHVCHSGTAAEAEKSLAPVRKLGKPLSDTVTTADYELVQKSGDTRDPRAIAAYMKSGFVSGMDEKLVTAMVDGFHGDPRRATVTFMQPCGGAGGRVASDATAFPNREAIGTLITLAGWRNGDEPADHIAATRKYWSTLEPFTHGFYVNDMAREATAHEVSKTFRGNYARLAALKATYDPTNLFRLNANVLPKA